MSFLGFDPDRLARLAAALEDLVAEPHRLASSPGAGEPSAVAALTAHRSAVAALGAWRPRLAAVLACRVGEMPSPPDPLDLRLLDVVRHGHLDGWLVVGEEEPLTDDPAGRARHLGELLVHHAPEVVARADRLVPVAALLAAATARPDGATAFLTAIGPAGLTALAGHLAAVGSTPAPAVTAAHGRAARQALAAVGRALARAGAVEPWAGALRAAGPVATAVALRSAHLPSARLADLAGEALADWRRDPGSAPPGHHLHHPASHPPTVVLARLARDPVAARLVVGALDVDTLAALLTGVDGHHAGAFLAAAHRPGSGPGTDIGSSLTRVLAVVHDRPHVAAARGLGAHLGAVAGPWVDALVLGAPLGQPAAGWSPDGFDGAAVLARLLADPASRADLLAAVPGTLGTRAAEVVTGGADPAAVGAALGRVAGEVDATVEERAVERAERRDGLYEAVWDETVGRATDAAAGVVGVAVGAVAGPAGGAAVAYGAERILDAGADRVRRAGQDAGVGPPSPGSVRRDERRALLARKRALAAHLAGTVTAAGAPADQVADLARAFGDAYGETVLARPLRR